MSALVDLQRWYASNCDGEWEHGFGVRIETLDNPGWGVTINLEETNLEGREFHRVEDKPSEESWIECSVEAAEFRGFGDPSRLEQILGVFVSWAKSQNEDWLKPPEPMSDEEIEKHRDALLFASLTDEVEAEKREHEGCTDNRIRHSVMCHRHHFETVTGRPAPKHAN